MLHYLRRLLLTHLDAGKPLEPIPAKAAHSERVWPKLHIVQRAIMVLDWVTSRVTT
jgi:hypothetical protein